MRRIEDKEREAELNQPLGSAVSVQRIEVYRKMTVRQLRAWLLHMSTTSPNPGAIRDCIYVIAEKRLSAGEDATPEIQWLKERGYRTPKRRKLL